MPLIYPIPFSVVLEESILLGKVYALHLNAIGQQPAARLSWCLRTALLPHLYNIQSPTRQQFAQLNHLLNPQRNKPSRPIKINVKSLIMAFAKARFSLRFARYFQ